MDRCLISPCRSIVLLVRRERHLFFRVCRACSRKAADRSHLGHTELDRWASRHLMICTRSATPLLVPSKRVLLEIRTSLRHCRSPFPGNGILRGRDRRRRKGPLQSTDRQQRQSPAGKPTNSALFARHRKISVCVGLFGGPGRTRTRNQLRGNPSKRRKPQ